MDIRPNKFDVDPLPFVVDPAKMPPIFQRWMWKTLHRDFFDKLKQDGIDDPQAFPPLRTIPLVQWVRAFNFTIVNLVQNGYMIRPVKSKDEVVPDLLGALTQGVPPKSKRGVSAVQTNRHYVRDAAERIITTKVARAFDTMAKELADEVEKIQQQRAAT